MNNKILMSIIAVVITALLAVLLIWVASSCDARSNPVYVEGEDHSEPEQEGESSEESSSVYGIEDSIFDDLEEGDLIGDFEGSDLPASSQPSAGNSSASSSSESSSEQNSGSSNSSSSKPSTGNSSSKPSSGSSSESSSSGSSEKPAEMTYKEYISMSPENQQKYMLSYEKIEDFFAWYNDAKAKYDEENAGIEIDGSIDLGDYINP